jgi:DNA polymerase-3 subunit delta
MACFGGDKLIWIRGACQREVSGRSLAALAQKPPEQTFLIVEAGDLKKGSLLRKASEAARSIMTIPCYADDVRALNGLIDAELAARPAAYILKHARPCWSSSVATGLLLAMN